MRDHVESRRGNSRGGEIADFSFGTVRVPDISGRGKHGMLWAGTCMRLSPETVGKRRFRKEKPVTTAEKRGNT